MDPQALRLYRSDMTDDVTLEARKGLPDALRILVEAFPRTTWETNSNFDGLVRFWLERHVMFRRVLEDLTQHSEHLIDRQIDPKGYKTAVSRYGGMFVNGLHEHHTIEDTYYFPKLAALDKRLSRGFDILDQDHHALDGHLQNFLTHANELISVPETDSNWRGMVGAFQTQLVRMERFLNRHLEDEEDLIVPIVLQHGADV